MLMCYESHQFLLVSSTGHDNTLKTAAFHVAEVFSVINEFRYDNSQFSKGARTDAMGDGFKQASHTSCIAKACQNSVKFEI